MSSQEIVERVGITWVEGRLENVLERQKQLVALHQSLQKQYSSIISALQKDLKSSSELATAETVATLDAINALYEQLNFDDVLAKERNLKNGGSSASFLVPIGVTLVAQLPSSPLISTLGPLAAALAAGNPTIVLGSPATPATNEIISQAIWDGLDREAFHFEKLADKPTSHAFAQQPYAVAVLPDLDASQTLGPLVRSANQAVRIIEPYHGISAGIIDRSARNSLDAAVEQIRRSVLSHSTGNPLRLPRLFLVDESVIDAVKSKLQARPEKKGTDLEGWLRKHYNGAIPRFATIDGKKVQDSKFPKVEGFETFTSSSGVEIALVSTTSLEISIDILNKINAGTGSQVIYIFAGGKEASYVGNFITTSHVFINEIPSQSIIFASSRSAQDTISYPYGLEDFSETKSILQAPPSGKRRNANKPAKLNAKRVKQDMGGKMSYFEQGLILGVAMGLVTLTGLGILSYRGVRTYLLR